MPRGLWDVAAATETACLEGHTHTIKTLALLPDGRLASGSVDKTVRLWNVATGAETTGEALDASARTAADLSSVRREIIFACITGRRRRQLHV